LTLLLAIQLNKPTVRILLLHFPGIKLIVPNQKVVNNLINL